MSGVVCVCPTAKTEYSVAFRNSRSLIKSNQTPFPPMMPFSASVNSCCSSSSSSFSSSVLTRISTCFETQEAHTACATRTPEVTLIHHPAIHQSEVCKLPQLIASRIYNDALHSIFAYLSLQEIATVYSVSTN